MSVKSIDLAHWKNIHDYAKKGWLYRGQRSAAWSLETSLERCCQRHGIRSSKRREFEDRLLREFRRAYHQYGQHIPERNALVEWLSLMQHHGAPTRLLDFTYSIYIAAYFATESADGDSAVWAINAEWAVDQSTSRFKAKGKRGTARMKRVLMKTAKVWLRISSFRSRMCQRLIRLILFV